MKLSSNPKDAFSAPGPGPRLLADVGGTNARFAWQASAGAPMQDLRILACADHPSLEAAVRHYLAGLSRQAPSVAAIAIANPVVGDQVRMTNHHWSFSIAALREAMAWAHLEVLNDFTALAMALPHLSESERFAVGGGTARAGAPIGLVGPGTGLGVSGLLPDGRGGWVPLQGEGGHASLAAVGAREAAVVDWLHQRHGHASAERAVSGMGLVDLHRALCSVDAVPVPAAYVTAADISTAALAGADARCVEAVDMMCAFLGSVAGNLALTLGAQGGVFIGGGIVPRLGDAFARSPFRPRFEAKGRFRSYLADIPVWVITAPQSPALLGAAHALDRALT